MSEEKKTFILKKSDVKKSDILAPLWAWTCPLCYRRIVTYTREKAIAAAKQHLERTHKYEVKVIEE